MIATPRDVTRPAGDPQVADLATPVNQSGLVKAYLNSLPAYRQGLSPATRGLVIGLFHGYWLIGPFAKLGPLRDTDIANLAGLFSTIGLVIIATLSVLVYAASNPPKATETNTTPRPPQELESPAEPRAWGNWAIGFLIGGVAGAVLAYLVLFFVG
ncbi:photosystem I subunit XI (PsaL) [uncultured Synechococcales cyanobacterium]|uniref:Photosystem I reaction center subunit XI n=1 Tax=uncultured Synechococcales cyanobacterium TaxID=1936017 RepID=A0A6J4VCP5_9CYAN|nr:photosystem I subunit XI (PsaL) [uncultured Synechococcales cyanobacterium]